MSQKEEKAGDARSGFQSICGVREAEVALPGRERRWSSL